MPVEQLVQKLCDLKQGYTQFGGLRPFGVSFLFAGHDPHHSFQLYASDPSGNYSGWKATCIGANNSTAQSLLRQDYRDDIGLDEAIGLALKVLSKTMDSTSLDSEKRESQSWVAFGCPAPLGAGVLTIVARSGACDAHRRRGDGPPLCSDLQAARDRCRCVFAARGLFLRLLRRREVLTQEETLVTALEREGLAKKPEGEATQAIP